MPLDELVGDGTDQHSSAKGHDQPEHSLADRKPAGDDAAQHERRAGDDAPCERRTHQAGSVEAPIPSSGLGSRNMPRMLAQPSLLLSAAAVAIGSRGYVRRVLPVSILDLAPIVEGGTPAQALANSIDLARHAERLGLHALLGRGAPQPERDRERGDVGRDRARGRRDRDDPGRRGRHHAAEPRAARDRRAVRDAGGAASRSDRSRSRARARHRSGHAARPAAGSERRLVPARRPGAAGAARRSTPGTDGVRDPRRRVACAALDPRLEPLRRAVGRGARPPVRVRLALRARSAAPGARGLPRALPALGATPASHTRWSP